MIDNVISLFPIPALYTSNVSVKTIKTRTKNNVNKLVNLVNKYQKTIGNNVKYCSDVSYGSWRYKNIKRQNAILKEIFIIQVKILSLSDNTINNYKEKIKYLKRELNSLRLFYKRRMRGMK